MSVTLEATMKNPLAGKSLVSISELTPKHIACIISRAKELKETPAPHLLDGKILACCFFEPSTRTRLSFEVAMQKLGGKTVGFSESANTSTKKGETLADSMRVIGSFVDVIAIRHPQEGAARLASEASNVPVINAGDGANQHPTQTLLDLYTIEECQGKIDGLQIAIVGDLKFGRTVHSLCLSLKHYAVRLYFVSPKNLTLPEPVIEELKKHGIKYSFHSGIEEVIPKVDILYMCRTQKERFPEDNLEFTNSCLLKKHHLKHAKPTLRILHPLPRVDEIEPSIDETPYAYYFQQAQNGVAVRMAILAMILDK